MFVWLVVFVVCFFLFVFLIRHRSREKGKEDEKELRGIEGEVIKIWIYCMRKKYLFSIKGEKEGMSFVS
jgi:heme/copper-type cytochrome/quinol oxidase subunit 2